LAATSLSIILMYHYADQIAIITEYSFLFIFIFEVFTGLYFFKCDITFHTIFQTKTFSPINLDYHFNWLFQDYY